MANVIYRGTTPEFEIECDFETSLITAIRICIRQGSTTINKVLSDCTLGTNKVTFTMTEAETNSLKEGSCQVQGRFKLNNAKINPTDKISVDVREPVDDVVMNS